MKMSVLVMGAALLLGSAGYAMAVNCKQVNKYLQTGRSAQDVAETMVIDEKEVKKCQEEAAAQAPAGGAPPKAADQKPGEAGHEGMAK